MFEPEHLNLTCPKCSTSELYFDRTIGFYCMLCGRRFSADEIEFLYDTEVRRLPKDRIDLHRILRTGSEPPERGRPGSNH